MVRKKHPKKEEDKNAGITHLKQLLPPRLLSPKKKVTSAHVTCRDVSQYQGCIISSQQKDISYMIFASTTIAGPNVSTTPVIIDMLRGTYEAHFGRSNI